jgi:HSP20 family protein
MSGLERWSPLTDLSELRSRLDRVLDDAAGGGQGWTPRIDVLRHENELLVRADVPGIPPEEIEVTVEDDVLTLSGKHEESHEEKQDDFLRRERRFGSFSRSVRLPAGTDPKRIEAAGKHGVLEVAIPLPEPDEPHRVRINAKRASDS